MDSKKKREKIPKSLLELEDNNGNKAFSEKWVNENVLKLYEKGNS